MEPTRLERVFADALLQVSPPLDFSVRGPAGVPGTFNASLAGRSITVAWLSVGWPRQARALLSRAKKPDLVGAPELSPGTRKLLSEGNVSWFDGTGAAQIRTRGLQIYIDNSRTLPRPPRRNLGWTPATLAVSESMLTGSLGTVSKVCESTGLAQSTVATSLKFLQEEHLLEAEAVRGRNASRSVVNPHDLLDAYAAAADRLRSPESIRAGILWRDPQRGAAELAKSWEEQGIRWSATSALAADVMAPLLTEVTPLEIYVQAKSRSELRQIALAAGVTERDGGRLLLRPFPTPAEDALSRGEGQIRVACWPRVYADLRSTGVRGEDAAEHLRLHMMKGPQYG